MACPERCANCAASIKAHFLHFRKDIITFLEREWGEILLFS